MEERATTVTEVRSRVNERIVDSFSHIQLDVSWTVTDGMVGNNMPSVIKSRVPYKFLSAELETTQSLVGIRNAACLCFLPVSTTYQ